MVDMERRYALFKILLLKSLQVQQRLKDSAK